MELVKNKSMKFLGIVALLLGAIVITPASTLWGHQPKCPEELLK